ncbi:MAG TPA: hypothetical protein VLM37_03730 [Fibrobacteraceae bacterium]|nr:hypothetical protein [Fibrobacteraceae bacterium]
MITRLLKIVPVVLGISWAANLSEAPAGASSMVAVSSSSIEEAFSVDSAEATALTVRLPDITDSLLDAKLDSISKALDQGDASNLDSAAVNDSTNKIRAAVQQGKYVDRANYDKSNFDHWKVDSVLQAQQKERVMGDWRTHILEHGHAFRDATLKFAKNDTLFSTTYTYTDSGRFYKTGEYSYKARYRFESDTTFRSREVFPDRNVVRWDYVLFKTPGDSLEHHLYKLEFRDLMDNWLDAIQEFDKVPPEVYYRTKASPSVVPAAVTKTKS